MSRSESRSGWKASLGSVKANMGGEFTAHAPALLEKAVSADSLKHRIDSVADTKARRSPPSPAMCFAQKAMSALSWRL